MSVHTAAMGAEAVSVAERWTGFHPSRDSLQGVPKKPGLVRVRAGEEWQEIFVWDVRAWLAEMREDLQSAVREGTGSGAEWWVPSGPELQERVAAPDGVSALAPGRPKKLKALADAPETWGLYRIHGKSDDSWYVGISSNLRARLRQHSASGVLDLPAGDSVDVLRAKDPDRRLVIWKQLQDAEEQHIQRLRDAGKNVRNITRGGNGRPPDVRFNAPRGEPRDLGRRDRSPIRNPKWAHLDLGIRILSQDQDWQLWLRRDNYVCAVPGSHGGRITHEGTLGWNSLQEKYRKAHRRDLLEDLRAVQRDPPTELQGILYWDGADLVDPQGRGVLRARDVMAVTSEQVREGNLPSDVEAAGLRVDPEQGRHGGLNHVLRVTGERKTGLWVKTEENPFAVSAELVFSAVLSLLDWPGLLERSKANESGSVVIVPDLGAGDIEDRGSFDAVFRFLRNETSASLGCGRAGVLKRVGLDDLRLADEFDALRLLLLDAVAGNSDRHRGNIHWGTRVVKGRESGFLLPIDHGRSLLNSDPSQPGEDPDTPIAVVTGRSNYSNPNQLLRPVSELVEKDYLGSVSNGVRWLQRVSGVAEDLLESPGWVERERELKVVRSRAEELGEGIESFLDEVTEVVVL